MPPAGYPAFLQYLQSGRVRNVENPGVEVTSGLTVPEFPSSSESPAMTSPGWFPLCG